MNNGKPSDGNTLHAGSSNAAQAGDNGVQRGYLSVEQPKDKTSNGYVFLSNKVTKS